jgi:hypothetical protein
MNVTLGARSSVHASARIIPIPACGSTRETSAYSITDREVTCKRCLKIVANREAHADRVDYYAGLADEQDMDLSQARVATAEQAPEADPLTTVPAGIEGDRCCEHADMYHGASGCDSCVCNTPRNVMPVAGEVTVGRNVETDRGRVPARALLVDAVNLSWIPSVRPGAVITATDAEGTVWTYVQHQRSKAEMLYVGRDLDDAAKARDAHVAMHTDYVATLGKHTGVTPTRVTQTIYGPIPAPASAEYETDPRTGLPVVNVEGVRYVVGIEQCGRFDGSRFVEFWEAEVQSFGFGTVFRASAASYAGAVGRIIWDAHRRIRNV